MSGIRILKIWIQWVPPSLNPVTLMPMNWMERGMASHKVLQWPQNEALAHSWRKPARFERLIYQTRMRWKEALIALMFWTAYSCACAMLLSR